MQRRLSSIRSRARARQETDMNFSQHEQNRIERMSYFLVNYILIHIFRFLNRSLFLLL